jgi:putative DNA primase/helicase
MSEYCAEISFDDINAAALVQLASLLRDWFPNGKRMGHEWRVGSIMGEAGDSFSVNMQTGKWAEFNGCGQTGGDVIGLYAAKFCRGDRVKAALDLAGKLAIEIKRREPPKPKPKVKPDGDRWVSLIPPPPDAGLPGDPMLSDYDMLHRYTSADGRETHFVGRIEARGDERKKFIPITYGELNDVRGWYKKAPNPPRPLYGLNKLTAMPDASVILCEGEKAADAAQRLFPDYVTISWFGGVAQVNHADFGPLANRSVIVWPDADASGLNAAHKLISRLPTDTQVVRTDGLSESYDAADLEREGCSDPAAWLSERLRPAHEFRSDRPPTGLVLPHGFSLNDRGLWHHPPRKDDNTEPEPVWVCGPFRILARTSDDAHHNHGLLLQWLDHGNERHTWPMPRRMVHVDGNAIAAELEDAGLSCSTSRKAHECLKNFLGAVTVKRRVQCVDHAGWHGDLFVLPNGRVFGADVESIVLQSEHVVVSGRYAERGTLEEWRSKIGQYAVGNDLLVLVISCAFAPPLLDVLGEPSGGLHLQGASQTGKTTLLRCSMSIYGPAEDRYVRTWRATANGLEAVAAETSDLLLPLDEISQANAREVSEIIYMLANSAGKGRANRAGGARRQQSWRVSFLSTGEITLEAKLSEAGQRARAGQDVRMIGLRADAGAGMGVWQNLHGLSSGAALTDHLRAASRTYCGTAGVAYLDQLARERADRPGMLATTLHKLRQKFLEAAKVSSDADGQVQSVAKRFALIAAAGELATACGITGWAEGEAMRASGACFARWLEARGGTDAGEDLRSLEQVRGFIGVHGSARFECIGAVAALSSVPTDDDQPPRVINRAGFKRLEGGAWEYLILPPVWRNEVCAGLDHAKAAEALARYGFLVSGTDRLTITRRCGTHGIVRGYCIRGTVCTAARF